MRRRYIVAALVAVALGAAAAVLFRAACRGPEPCAAEAAYAADLATVAHLFSGHEATDPRASALVDAAEALRVCLTLADAP